MAQNRRVNYYTNPAFCQQSEFYLPANKSSGPQSTLTRCASMREAPVGAHAATPQKFERFGSLREYSSAKNRHVAVEMDENEYKINQQVINEMKMEEMNISKNRYAYIATNQTGTISPPPIYQPKTVQYENPVVHPSGRVHRYATIPTDDDDEDEDADENNSADNEEYAIREMSPQRVHFSATPDDNYNRNNYLQNHVDQNGNTPPKHRFVPIPAPRTRISSRNSSIVQTTQSTHTTPTPNICAPITPKKYNPIATQKLHELLSTPRKTPQRSNSLMVTPQKLTPVTASTPKRAKSPPPSYPLCVSPNRTKNTSPQQTPRTASYYATPPYHYSPQLSPTNQNYVVNYSLIAKDRVHGSAVFTSPPKAQQKLQYMLPNKQFNITTNPMMDSTRNTAIIQPMCTRSPAQSLCSETTFSGKSNSWMNLSQKLKDNTNATLAAAALMMVLCGALTTAFCFYMISVIGRKYYLDFALVSGFTCFILGLLGFRTRSCRWLPNRNYISGYIVLSVFSLLTCGGLLLLLGLRPKPGSPLADITSGAVCGISALSLLLASLGVLTSYCCKYPPPDNRVEHCAPGFTV